MKKTRPHAPALVGVLVSVVAFSAGPAWGDQSSRPALGNRISKCGTISKPGSYVLTRNLTARGDCLVVAASSVTIDLGGWMITGNGTGSGITDQEAGRAITVRNGTVTGFDAGVDLGASSVVIEKVRADGLTTGIAIDGGIVSGNIASAANEVGIRAGPSSILSGNIAHAGQFGIVAGRDSVVIGNTAFAGEGGIRVGPHTVISGNSAGGIPASLPTARAALSVATLALAVKASPQARATQLAAIPPRVLL